MGCEAVVAVSEALLRVVVERVEWREGGVGVVVSEVEEVAISRGGFWLLGRTRCGVGVLVGWRCWRSW